MLSSGSVVIIITDSYSDADKMCFFDSMDILNYESSKFANDVKNKNMCPRYFVLGKKCCELSFMVKGERHDCSAAG